MAILWLLLGGFTASELPSEELLIALATFAEAAIAALMWSALRRRDEERQSEIARIRVEAAEANADRKIEIAELRVELRGDVAEAQRIASRAASAVAYVEHLDGVRERLAVLEERVGNLATDQEAE